MVNGGVCPQCRLPRGATDERRPADTESDKVDWAGLPVNLDFTFSQAVRDKVYAQHLMRKRGSQLFRTTTNGGQVCGCELAGVTQLDTEAGQHRVEWISDNRRHVG
ncbi:hypothetical protein [Mycobacterium sherrisii]|uniref:Uncharacterized protein n=1 Tax=Mycobacterium sherrisii TaxID=243061 RepID=A0A1E3SJ05_9MYCO|nr:hypothetical protein [Mycobacterium sherrisii]MCV7027653.1 hypothetical protein [Mycobacterium sherrisii]MEC4765081.1 hypothetical protein [Mycobacterium sherrisii]ODR02109.1 hypothetical protein BHQ21_22825 [Mycobacterium sherrisii]ORW76074.1 hypothetical protein AWC25_12330 [Mycobacterium sherrisii]